MIVCLLSSSIRYRFIIFFLNFILLSHLGLINNDYASAQTTDQYYANRQIFPLHSYRDITMFRYSIPEETITSRWTIWSNSTANCDSKDIVLLIRWQGYPLLIPGNTTPSKDFLIDLSEQYELNLKTGESRTTSLTLDRPLPGFWFGIAFIRQSTNRIIQRGFYNKCKVSISSRLSLVKLKLDEEVKLLTSDSLVTYRLNDKKYFKFYLPLHTNSAKLTLSSCSRLSAKSVEGDGDEESSDSRVSKGCPVKIYFRSRGLPSDRHYDDLIDCSANLSDDECIANGLNITQESWNYALLVRKRSRDDIAPIEFSLSVMTTQCIHSRNIDRPATINSPSSLSQAFPSYLFSSSSLPFSSSDPSSRSDPALQFLSEPSTQSPSPSSPSPAIEVTTEKVKVMFPFSKSDLPSSNNPLWFSRHLLKTQEDELCPFRVNLVRYNLHGSFNFQYDYSDAFKTRAGHFTYTPFIEIPNSMELSSESTRNSFDGDLGLAGKKDNRMLKDNSTELSVLNFEILPILDSGGTLTIDLGLNPSINLTENNVSVSGCLSEGTYSTDWDHCRHQIRINSSHNPLVTLKIPYPRAGIWFISMRTDCYTYDGWGRARSIKCRFNTTSIILDIKSNSCFENQCGKHGKCHQFISGGLIFSTCICSSGWKGLDCKDGSDALDEREILLNFLLLTLSNLVFIPALILALYRRLCTEAFIYFIAMSSSILYHACDSDSDQAFCLVRLNILQYVDFYSALLAFWVTLISLSNLPDKARTFLHLVGSVALAIGVEYDRTSLWTFLVPVSAGFIIVMLTWCFFCCIKRNCFPSCQLWSLSMIPGMVMTSAGLVIYSLFETKDNYPIVHSFWHAVMASALLFLIPTMESKATQSAPDEEEENLRGKVAVPNTKRAHVEWRPNTSFKFLQDDIDML